MLNKLKIKFLNFISDKKFSEILTGSIWALTARVLATGIGMLASVIVARFYGVEMVGVVAVVHSFLSLITIFTVLGTDTSILRMIPEHLCKYSALSAFKLYKKTQYFVIILSIISGFTLFFLSDFIANRIFFKPHLQIYFSMAAIFIIFQSAMVLNSQAVRGLRLIKIYAFMQLLPSLSKVVILSISTIYFFNENNPIYAMFSSIAITSVVGVYIMDQIFKKRIEPNTKFQPIAIKEILFISLPMLMAATMSFLIGQTGIIMLGILRTETEVGYYSVAVRLASLTSFMLGAINSMAAPKFSELFHSNKIEDLFYVAQKSTKLIFWTTAPVLLFLIILGKQTISFLFGSNFTVAYEAMIFLIIGQFVNSISGSTGCFMNMTGNQKIFQNIMLISAFLNIILNIIFIPSLGIYGAAISGMFCMIFWNILTLSYIKIKYKNSIAFFKFTNSN